MKTRVMTLGVAMVLGLMGFASAAEHFDVDAKIDLMKVELNLTDEQVKAVKPVLEEFKKKLDAAENEKKQSLTAILSADQMSKMKEIKKDEKKME